MKSKRGNAALEFALILPVFIALVFGGIDYSWLLLQRLSLQDAVSAGCKAGSMSMIDIYTDPYIEAEGHIMRVLEANPMLSCGVDCVVEAEVSSLTTPTLPWVDCRATISYTPLTGIVPGLPEALSSASSWPIEVPEVEDIGT
jgi:hypothetical protein